MASNEKIINKYLKAAKKDCPKRLRKKLDTELKSSLTEFCGDTASVSYESLEKHFGKPEQYAAEYISSLDGIHINKKLCRSKRIWCSDPKKLDKNLIRQLTRIESCIEQGSVLLVCS